MPPSASTATARTRAATDNGADLVRSEVVLHDRYGSTIGPFLKKGHPTQTTPVAQLEPAQIEDLSHTIHQEVYNTLRSALEIQNVLTATPRRARLTSMARASARPATRRRATCEDRLADRSADAAAALPLPRRTAADAAGAARPPANPVTVTVTPASGAAITGVLVHLDDFNVALRDSAGEYRSFKRTAAYEGGEERSRRRRTTSCSIKYTDKNMHDIVAYLETLK